MILPLISACIAGLFGRALGFKGLSVFSTSCLGFVLMISCIAFYEVSTKTCFAHIKMTTWIDSGVLNSNWGFLFDSLTVTMCFIISFISFLVHLYSIGYMFHDPHLPPFMSYLSLFTFFMLILVTAGNFVQRFVVSKNFFKKSLFISNKKIIDVFTSGGSAVAVILITYSLGVVQNSIFNVSLNELTLIPEFFLAFSAVTIITHCSLIASNRRYNSALIQFSVTSLSILILFLTFLLYLHEEEAYGNLYFQFFFLRDSLGLVSKIITITASLFCMYLLQDYNIEYKINSTEYYLLMLYAVLGLTALITANDFGTIFLSIELISLSFYLLWQG
jgi:NADH:ubiquinone oxidoreductase subunit 2 (subunit N)